MERDDPMFVALAEKVAETYRQPCEWSAGWPTVDGAAWVLPPSLLADLASPPTQTRSCPAPGSAVWLFRGES